MRAGTTGGRQSCKQSSRSIPALAFGAPVCRHIIPEGLAGWRSCTQSRYDALHPLGMSLSSHVMPRGMQVVTYDASPAAGAAPACIQNTWTFFQSVMASREDEAWRAVVSDAFGTCRPLQSSGEVEDLAYWVQVRRAAQRLPCWHGMAASPAVSILPWPCMQPECCWSEGPQTLIVPASSSGDLRRLGYYIARCWMCTQHDFWLAAVRCRAPLTPLQWATTPTPAATWAVPCRHGPCAPHVSAWPAQGCPAISCFRHALSPDRRWRVANRRTAMCNIFNIS